MASALIGVMSIKCHYCECEGMMELEDVLLDMPEVAALYPDKPELINCPKCEGTGWIENE